jgi:2-deoxy-D-gluconate 3-dehydrogenase
LNPTKANLVGLAKAAARPTTMGNAHDGKTVRSQWQGRDRDRRQWRDRPWHGARAGRCRRCDCAQHGAKAIALVTDVTEKGAVTAMVEHVTSELGRIDILVNNAGINIRKPPQALDLEEWDRVLRTNLTSAFLCSQAVYPAMKAAGGGKIINIGSMMSIFGASFAPAYAASKGGIVQFTRACACAWAADNIQANAILPGWIDTDLTKGARQQIDGLHDKVLARTPAARWGDIADFAGIAVFLSSAASDFVTGTAIPVDGGFSVMG